MALTAGLPVAVIAIVLVLAASAHHVAAAAHSSSSSSAVRSSTSSSVSASGALTFGPSTFTVPGAFPTSVYSRYYNNPTATASQVQPVITDPVTGQVYPFELTNPLTVPTNNTQDPHPLPPPSSPSQLLTSALSQIHTLATNPIFLTSSTGTGTCAACQAALGIGKVLAMTQPDVVPDLMVQLCVDFGFKSSRVACEVSFGALGGDGRVITQVLASADVAGYDGQLLCQNFLSLCPLPPTSALNLTGWFAKPKPNPLPAPRKPSGKRLKVLHMSDIHIDPRYMTGAEVTCSSGLCCRDGGRNANTPNQTVFPAPRFGAYPCDSPYALVLSAIQAIPILAGTSPSPSSPSSSSSSHHTIPFLSPSSQQPSSPQPTTTPQPFSFSIYTGDLVAHDAENQLSREYVMYCESVLYDLMKRVVGGGAPVYAALGNHDSYNQAQDAPHSLGGELADQFSWNYDHVAGLWDHEQWIPESAVDLAKAHYGAYMVRRADGLRVITLNTDFWYRANYFNYINLESADTSGMLRFLTDELQDAEDVGDRVWIIGHVLSGWDGTNPLENPTNLFYQIVDRFSPHVIANMFWGHTHEDQVMIYYKDNATVISTETAQSVGWVGPSVTPNTNLNSGFRVYEVDSNTFEILDAHTWSADVNSFSALDSQLSFGPAFEYEYSTREAYGATITGWGPNDPLNATWWHRVTEAMQADNSLVTKFNTFQGKSSVKTEPCTGTCIQAKICYIQSGSGSIARQNCPAGFGSVQ